MADDKRNGENKAAEEAGAEQEFGIQRLYTRDVSFETPNSPKIFLEQWEPEMNLDLATNVETLEDHVYDVQLTVTVTVKIKETVAFLAEVKQCGIFAIKGFDEDHLKQMLGSYCPNVLYPYAREVVTHLVMQGGFPQVYLTPVNFDALYQQQQQQEAGSETTH